MWYRWNTRRMFHLFHKRRLKTMAVIVAAVWKKKNNPPTRRHMNYQWKRLFVVVGINAFIFTLPLKNSTEIKPSVGWGWKPALIKDVKAQKPIGQSLLICSRFRCVTFTRFDLKGKLRHTLSKTTTSYPSPAGPCQILPSVARTPQLNYDVPGDAQKISKHL